MYHFLMQKDELLNRITSQYLESHDFNGYPLRNESKSALRDLIADDLITIVFGDTHPNPHIKALVEPPPNKTLEKLDKYEIQYSCAYPTPKHLASVIDPVKYSGLPYKLELARGSAQLSHRSFELRVLEFYRNDPRYYYESDDIFGRVHLRHEGMEERDEIYLRFGFSYDENRNRYVAAFLWDLFRLAPEQQQYWRLNEVTEKTKLHSDYYRSQVLGEFPENISLYEAFILELRTINEMAVAMGRPKFFRNDLKEDRPKEFTSLLRPTKREFNNFVRLLDSMMSDNINLAFFKNEVLLETEILVGEGRYRLERKGSIKVLEEWLHLRFKTPEPEQMNRMIETFREVRGLRNKPSHTPTQDEFSPAISTEQRELIIRAYGAVRTLRLIFACHPDTRAVKVNEDLYEGNIWTG